MPGNQVFIEFGSLATKVIKAEDKKTMLSILHPLTLINKEGDFNIEVYIERVLNNLKNFLNENFSAVNRICGFATGIYRTAQNRENVINLIKGIKGLDLHVLTIEQECNYSFRSYYSTNYHLLSKYVVYIDMGGGSTELALFKSGKLEKFRSLPFGILNLVVLFFGVKGKLKDGIQTLETIINLYCVDEQLFFEYLKNHLMKNDCSLVITGMVVKKIYKRYRSEIIMDLVNYEKYLEELRIPLGELNNIGHIKRHYEKAKGQIATKTNLYLGGLFLKKILLDLEVDAFHINDKGLHDAVIGEICK